MSATAVIWPILSAVNKAALFLGMSAGSWLPVNSQQETFLTSYYSDRAQLQHFSETELRTWASTSHEELNKVLRDEKFTIQLEPFLPSEFGVVSILDVLVTWLHEGCKTQLASEDGKIYPAVRVKDGIRLYKDNTIACLETKTGDKVWMCLANGQLEGFPLIEMVKKLQVEALAMTSQSGQLIFPMVDMDIETDISWLKGMGMQDVKIMQALQQTKFKMNEKGARVSSAVAIGVSKCIIPNTLVINKPFYVWIERPGLSHPIFAGYITQEHWREPQESK